MGSPSSIRKRRYFGPGDGKKRYILTEERNIYTIDSRAKLEILEALPERGALRWNTLVKRIRQKGVQMAENRLCVHVRHLASADLVGVLTPENRKRLSLHRDKLYRTDLKYEVIDVEAVKRLLGVRKTKSWRRKPKSASEPSQMKLNDEQFN